MPLFVVRRFGAGTARRYGRSPVLALETDATQLDDLPSGVRSIADMSCPGSLHSILGFGLPSAADAALTWFSSDRLLCGHPARIRLDLQVPGRRCLVPVHLAGLPEAPLIALEPRWLGAGPVGDYYCFHLRIQRVTALSTQTVEALRSSREAWAQLSLALNSAPSSPASAMDVLQRLWTGRAGWASVFTALVLRNLAVIQTQQKEFSLAEQLLDLGMQNFAGYADLRYLSAVLCFLQRRESRAISFLEQARSHDAGFVGTGGESTYRVDWLLGLLAARVGNQQVAFNSFRPGLTSDPPFLPSIQEILALRVSRECVEAHQWDFFRAAREVPQLLERILDYFLRHRAFAPACHLLDTVSLADEAQSTLRERLRLASAPFAATQPLSQARPGIVINGPFFERSSLGRINREIATGLIAAGTSDISLEPSAFSTLPPDSFPSGALLATALRQHPTRLSLTIRHRWPPDLETPSCGKLAILLPWEYGAVPRIWIDRIGANADELWCPSQFVREIFLRSGVDSDRVQVIPPGFDPEVFHPRGQSSRPQGARRFIFLFVGGAIRRKGVDLLLHAYRAAFDSGDDVTLALNVTGAGGAYQHNSLLPLIREIAADRESPHIQLLLDSFDDPTLANLYRGCDAFVLPYRGEGFGMPLLEAMACGKPVITTALGPAPEFCPRKFSYFVPAQEVEVPDDPPPLGPLVGNFTWFEPGFDELARTMRHVFEHREEAAAHGQAAAKFVLDRYTWGHVLREYHRRINYLTGCSPAISETALAEQHSGHR